MNSNLYIYILTNPTTGETRTFRPLNGKVGYAGSFYTTIDELRFEYARAVSQGFTSLEITEAPEYQPDVWATGAWRKLGR